MLIDRAKVLAKRFGLKLVEGESNYTLNLYDGAGNYIDSLHQVQIGYLKEEDYISFYLNDGVDSESYYFEDYD